MRNVERANQGAINRLNQRGGRMLSLVDLLAAGTVGLEMAAEMARTAATGGSFLTAAGPGGVGKTTLMGAMLAFVAPGTEIVAVEGPETLDPLAAPPPPPDRPECLVVHEIGAGPYYGYLWGPAVARYFEVAATPGRALASNLHAETFGEARGQLCGPPLGVTREALGRIDLFAFMARQRGKRRVTDLWRGDGRGGHERAWRWRPADDAFERLLPAADQGDLDRYVQFLEFAREEGVVRMEDLRRRAIKRLVWGDGGRLSRGP